MKTYEKLFTPGTINSLTVKNRIIMPPMGMFMAHLTGETSDKLIEVFARRARGGAGMLITEPYFPEKQLDDFENAREPYHSPRAFYNPKLGEYIEAVQVHDCRFCASLSPLPQKWMLRQMKAVSELRMDEFEAAAYQGLGIFNKLTTGQIEGYIDDFARVAGDLKANGVDAIEINFAFICDYFTLGLFNKREDKYGGETLDERLTFVRELIEETRRAVGKAFPIMLMIDAHQYMEGWRTIEDTCSMAVKFQQWGIDCMRCRAGTSIVMQYDCLPMYLPKGAVAHLAAQVKEVVEIPVVANGKLSDPEVAEKLLREGKADFISIARGLLADPDLPNKIRTGNADRVRKCISCNIGCLGNLMLSPIRPMRCTINPLLGVEEKFPEIRPALRRKKVVIAGAGPGGMSAALTAAQRGHEVVLLEKTAKLGGGGQFRLACIPPFKEELLYIPEYYEREFRDLKNITIHYKTLASADSVLQEKPDAVIIATGSRAYRSDLPGGDAQNVLTYEDILTGGGTVGGNVVVIGGGSAGCETALYLLHGGAKVTILEMLPRVLGSMNAATRNCLVAELAKAGATVIEKARVVSIGDGRVCYTRQEKEETVQADSVVTALGAAPEDGLYTGLKEQVHDLHKIGDARAPRQIMEAVREGFYAAYYL